MKKFSKAGAPARKSAAGSGAPKRAYAPRTGDAPKRAYAPRTGDAPKRAYAPRDSDAPKRAYAPRSGDAPKRAYAPRDSEAPKRAYAPRSAAGSAAPRRSYSRDEAAGAPPPRSAYGDPYERAQRPPRGEDSAGGERPAARGFTVTLDPDVARVFRGDASVNKALRLILQMMQVVEGPPRTDRPAARPRAGYQGTDEARGFVRKPRFVEDADEE
jgi:hypothetical protein